MLPSASRAMRMNSKATVLPWWTTRLTPIMESPAGGIHCSPEPAPALCRFQQPPSHDSWSSEASLAFALIVMFAGATKLAPFAGLVFKLMADKHLGQLAFVRIYSGTVTSGSYVYNTIKNTKERVGRLMLMHANKRLSFTKPSNKQNYFLARNLLRRFLIL